MGTVQEGPRSITPSIMLEENFTPTSVRSRAPIRNISYVTKSQRVQSHSSQAYSLTSEEIWKGVDLTSDCN